jgi:hypothetical protein
MIFAELQNSIADLLNADAYFTQSPACPVYWQGQKEDADKKPLETAKAMQAALNNAGATAMVMYPTVRDGGNDHAEAQITILFLENVVKNKATTGTQKSAWNFAVKAMAILMQEQNQVAPWSQFFFDSIDDDVDIEAEGHIGWTLKCHCRTLLDTVIYALADELGALLVTENDEPLLVSPTEP